MTDFPRTCPATPCGAVLEAGHLLCRDHWKAVPRALRGEVNSTWRTLCKLQTVGSLANHRDARVRAIQAARKAMP